MILPPDAERVDSWDGTAVETLRERWDVPLLHVYRSIGSTNDAARLLAEAGAPAGTVVLADAQTAGRGQRGRRWHAPAGAGLLLSVVLRPEVPDRAVEFGTLPLRVGLGVVRAIESLTDARAMVKWPNDVLVAERKVAGILCEGALDLRRGGFVVAGIGVNVLQQAAAFPEALRETAGSILSTTGTAVGRADLAASLLREVRILAAVAAPLDDALVTELDAHDALRGKTVSVDGARAGIACGLSADGALFVRRGDTVSAVRTGTVRPISQQGS